MFSRTTPQGRDAVRVTLLVAILALTLATAWIHSTLGGLLFTLNALGYLAFAVALVFAFLIPLRIVQQLRWLPRLALIGYALATIVGWLLMGPRYDMAYISKAIEVVLIALLAVDLFRTYGTPSEALRRARGAIAEYRGDRGDRLASA